MSDATEQRVFAATLADLVEAGAIPRDEAHTDRAAEVVRRSFRYQSAMLVARINDLGRVMGEQASQAHRRLFPGE